MALLWRTPDDYPQDAIGTYDRVTSPDRFVFRRGSVLSLQEVPTIRFGVQRAALVRFDCLPNNSLIPLVSSRVRDLLNQLGVDDVQFFEASVTATDGAIPGYWLLNATHCVRGLDHSRSISMLIPGTEEIMGFRKLHYRQGCLGRYHIARDAEYRSHLLVSARVYEQFQHSKITGVALLFPQEVYR
jgi:hypothetical protein